MKTQAQNNGQEAPPAEVEAVDVDARAVSELCDLVGRRVTDAGPVTRDNIVAMVSRIIDAMATATAALSAEKAAKHELELQLELVRKVVAK